MCPRIMRSEPPKKNEWLNRKPLDNATNLWYNEYSQEGGGNHDTRTALMKETSPIKIFKEI